MTITLIVTIIAIALALLLLEILVVPGVGIPGIAGSVMLVIGVIIAYKIDAFTGHVTLGATGLISIGLGFLAFNNKTWDKMASKGEITSRVSHNELSVLAGTKGKAISRLNPTGNAMINETQFEVSTRGEYIEEGSAIEVLKVEFNKIIVIPA
jgi:membrane-bound ClpP family serine protease